MLRAAVLPYPSMTFCCTLEVVRDTKHTLGIVYDTDVTHVQADDIRVRRGVNLSLYSSYARTPNSKECIPNSSKFQKIWSIWQILLHIGSDFGNIEDYIPGIPEVFQCIPCRNIFLVQYFG